MFRYVLKHSIPIRAIATASRPVAQKEGCLGRWKIEKSAQEIDRHIDLNNTDHCGGDLCVQQYSVERDYKRVIPQIGATNGDDDDDDDNHPEIYYLPYTTL